MCVCVVFGTELCALAGQWLACSVLCWAVAGLFCTVLGSGSPVACSVLCWAVAGLLCTVLGSGWLALYCAGQWLTSGLLCTAGLSVSLDEPGSESTPITLGDSPRSIPLVQDHSYEISCDGNWFHNGSPLSDTAPAEGVSGAYVMTDGSKEKLILQLFSEEQADQYVCEEMGQQFVLNFTSGTTSTCA